MELFRDRSAGRGGPDRSRPQDLRQGPGAHRRVAHHLHRVLFSTAICPRTSGRFLQRHRGIDLAVMCTRSPLSLSRNDADLALRFTQAPPETLAGRRLAKVAYSVYAASGSTGDRFSSSNRQDWEWIGIPDEVYNRMLFKNGAAGRPHQAQGRQHGGHTVDGRQRARCGISAVLCRRTAIRTCGASSRTI